jgi:pyruvate,orthophosphate dikinase
MGVVALTPDLALDRQALGGKAWSITEMLRHGIPVPPAFALTTDECTRYYQAGRTVPADVLERLPEAMAGLERATGSTFAGGERPLLVSVRSGAPTSMPGMMDTILNLGIDDRVQRALAVFGGERYAADTRRRFEEQFENVVGSPAPSDAWDQLRAAIAAVFDSWSSDRAVHYRAERGIPATGGTAVTVQAMVFGNLDQRSGTGVMFSRDPTGASGHYGEWLPGGQGEDVVSGAFSPLPLEAMRETLPDAYGQLLELAQRLDENAGEAQDIEFTVQSGKLWLLQCRRAKVICARGAGEDARTSGAPPAPAGAGAVLASGRPACPGSATGVVVCDVLEAQARAIDGEDVILARPTTSPHDVRAMSVVAGIITELGGATSHAAIVSRELGVPCVVGVGAGAATQLEGRHVALDATQGLVLEIEGR